jgi:uncharacterized protein (UPF0332 family)
MSFNWSEYLSLAHDLAGQSAFHYSVEAKTRSAVSRAYYSVFIQARNFLRDRENYLSPRTTSIHNDVIEKFRTS